MTELLGIGAELKHARESRGLAIDENRQHFIVACSEGTIAVLDAANGGHVLAPSLNHAVAAAVLRTDVPLTVPLTRFTDWYARRQGWILA